MISLRVDADVLVWFKAQGAGYQTRMNAVLLSVGAYRELQKVLARFQFGLAGVVTRVLVLLASFASIITLVLDLIPMPSPGLIALLGVAGVIVVFIVVNDFIGHTPYHVFRRGDAKGIGKYMYKWIKNGGRVAIWTRDMSWANDDEIRSLLRTKSKTRELVVCISKPTDLTEELGSLGAEIYFYGDHMQEPESRFTIANFRVGGSSVAVGRPAGRWHVIEEFQAGHHPASHMASDLVNTVMALKQNGGQSS